MAGGGGRGGVRLSRRHEFIKCIERVDEVEFRVLQSESAGTSESTFPTLVLFIRSRKQSSWRGGGGWVGGGGQGWLTNAGGPCVPASNHTAPARISAGQLHVCLPVPADGPEMAPLSCDTRDASANQMRRQRFAYCTQFCSCHCSAPACESDWPTLCRCRRYSWVSENYFSGGFGRIRQ